MRDATTIPGDINPYDEHLAAVVDRRIERRKAARGQSWTPVLECIDKVQQKALDGAMGGDRDRALMEINGLCVSLRKQIHSRLNIGDVA